MSLHGPNTPSQQAFTDSAWLVSTTVPALRWRREPGGTINRFWLRIENASSLTASFKIQQSTAADASQDQISLVTVPEDTDPTTSSNFAYWYNQIGLFSASFTDIAGLSYSVVPNGFVNIYFDTMAPFIQIIPTVGNKARIHIRGTSSQKLTLFSNEETVRAPGETNDLNTAPGEPADVLDYAPIDA